MRSDNDHEKNTTQKDLLLSYSTSIYFHGNSQKNHYQQYQKTLPFILHSLCISQPPQQNCFSFSFLFFLLFFTSLSPLLVLSKEYLLLKAVSIFFCSILWSFHLCSLLLRSDELIHFFTRFEDWSLPFLTAPSTSTSFYSFSVTYRSAQRKKSTLTSHRLRRERCYSGMYNSSPSSFFLLLSSGIS